MNSSPILHTDVFAVAAFWKNKNVILSYCNETYAYTIIELKYYFWDIVTILQAFVFS